jgi:uncharacterized Fe-S cluster-containing radical SAM superfamily protein
LLRDEVYDPIELAERLLPVVTRGRKRKYYRLGRKGMWYGGIATADCLGCSLKCVFCWSNKPRDNPERMGEFHGPDEIYTSLVECARREGYKLVRVSGNEPAMAREHLLGVVELVERSGYRFILETNGLHVDSGFARALSLFSSVHVRVSLKGANREEFQRLTGARGDAFDLQLEALRNLVANGVSCHAAVMSSFSTDRNLWTLEDTLKKIHPALAGGLEMEELILYPHVAKRLKKAGIYPAGKTED